MSRVFAWIMALLSVGMLVLQFGVADSPNIPAGILLTLVLLICVYVLFFKKPKEKAR